MAPHWKRFTPNHLLLLINWYGAKHLEFGQFYCRAVNSFVVDGVRIYEVRACDSLLGKMSGPTFNVPGVQLRDTGRKVVDAKEGTSP